MKTHTNDGGPAFPCKYNPCGLDTSMHKPELSPRQCRGMTIRAWLAGLAMQSIIANPDTVSGVESVAIFSTKYADALIAQLEKEKE